MKTVKKYFLNSVIGIFLLAVVFIAFFFFITAVGFHKQNAVETILTNDEKVNYLPFEYSTSGHLKVYVSLENGASYPFILDSGASSTLFYDIAGEIDKRLSWIMPSLDSNGSFSFLKAYKLNALGISDFLIFKNPFFETTKGFKSECDTDIKGILGVNLMKELKWRINFRTQKIEIADDVSMFNIMNPLDTIKTYQNAHSHHLKARFTSMKDSFGINKLVLIDTGYSGFLTVSKFDGINRIFRDSVRFKGLTSQGLYSEKSNELTYLADGFSIDGTNYNNMAVNVTEAPFDALGLGFFRQFDSVVLDWEHNLILLEKQESEPSFLEPLFGVGFGFEDNKCYLKAALKSKTKDLTNYLNRQILTINGVEINDPLELCELNLDKDQILGLEVLSENNEVLRISIKKEPLFRL
jgi:hypothetical protein